MCENGSSTVVVDNGSGMCKAGLASGRRPSAVFPSIVGRPLVNGAFAKPGVRSREAFYVGNEAQKRRHILALKYPIEDGVIKYWDDMEEIWHHMFFGELLVLPTDCRVLLTQAPPSPKGQEERMAEIMFETFGVAALHIAPQTVLPLYAAGRTTGLVLECGDGVTSIAPVYEGYHLPHDVVRLDVAGRQLTAHLMTMLSRRGYFLSTTAEREIVRDIKERLCFVAQTVDKGLPRWHHRHPDGPTQGDTEFFELPDGRTIAVGEERFLCPEALFQPSLIDSEWVGVHRAVHGAIMNCDIDCRKQLFRNIIASGGSAMFPGFIERLKAELDHLIPCTIKARVLSRPACNLSVWIGASVLASLHAFESMLIFKQEYHEIGPQVFDKH